VASGKRSFATIRRRWRKNDVVELKLPLGFRREAIDDRNPETVATMYGPLMLVAVDPAPEVAAAPLPPLDSLKPVPHRASYFTAGAAERPLVFAPFYSLRDETYTTYLRAAKSAG
jgi:uncharacterized protein